MKANIIVLIIAITIITIGCEDTKTIVTTDYHEELNNCDTLIYPKIAPDDYDISFNNENSLVDISLTYYYNSIRNHSYAIDSLKIDNGSLNVILKFYYRNCLYRQDRVLDTITLIEEIFVPKDSFDVYVNSYYLKTIRRER
jgi:hypothetical protein